MSQRATGSFVFTRWDEQPFSEIDGGPKLTHARVSNLFKGDIVGETALEYLMVYRDESHASFCGLERLTGRIGGRTGSFVLQHSGTFAEGTVEASWTVVPDSATGELRGLRGAGGFVARHGQQETPYTLDYDFA